MSKLQWSMSYRFNEKGPNIYQRDPIYWADSTYNGFSSVDHKQTLASTHVLRIKTSVTASRDHRKNTKPFIFSNSFEGETLLGSTFDRPRNHSPVTSLPRRIGSLCRASAFSFSISHSAGTRKSGNQNVRVLWTTARCVTLQRKGAIILSLPRRYICQ